MRQSYDIPASIDKEKYKGFLLKNYKKSKIIKRKTCRIQKKFRSPSNFKFFFIFSVKLRFFLVWLDTNEGLIVGTGTLKVEKKFSHNLGRVKPFFFKKNTKIY